ncbi:START domain-containing protein [Cephalotus follicularis]|uniref:START domain-containing protein n=1 Tax=Cephalotus follicularis TaxID=3775 RepID=A0A1Q3AY53_CEPFO|nr:START domain-containing protein [Cephalotus follicularis]
MSTNVRRDKMPRASDLLMSVSVGADSNKGNIIELAITAMDEVTKKALKGEPLWELKGGNGSETLNAIEYLKEFGSLDETLKAIIKLVEVSDHSPFSCSDANGDFSGGGQKKLGVEPFMIEASRYTAIVRMRPMNLVELLMDVKQWLLAFSSIVSRATLLGVLSTKSDDFLLQVMSAEFNLPTTFVPSRECHFARYCKWLGNRTWGVVDVSLESVFPYPNVNFRRRPSGCLIEEMPNGCSKVIWVEHVEVDNDSIPPIFRCLVTSGYAFSAKRWVASIIRHCEEQSTIMATTPSMFYGVITQAGSGSLLKLAERMMRSFYVEMCASSANKWMSLPLTDGGTDIRYRIRDCNLLQGGPPFTTAIFTTSLWISLSPKRLFNFLRHPCSRNKWDMLAYGHLIQEIGHFVKGENPQNRVSIVQVNAAPNQVAILHLQESYTTETVSYVVYTPMDFFAMSTILNGGNPDNVGILPSGFAIFPGRAPRHTQNGDCGSILTIGFHIIDNSSSEEYMPIQSIETIRKIIETTATLIKIAVQSDDPR